MVSSTSSLLVWHDRPKDVFPVGEHVFVADSRVAMALRSAVREDLTETHLVPASMLGAERPAPWPLRLTSLRAFLAVHASSLDDLLGGPAVAANSREYGQHLVARLRALGAPSIIIAHEEAELARVSSPHWKATVDIDGLVPDVLGAASLVQLDSRVRRGWPLAIDADIGELVLLAASCCIRRDAVEVQWPWLDELTWTSLLDAEPEEAPVAEGFIRVRAAVYPERIGTLGLADVRRSLHASALAPADALLRVVVSEED